MSSDPSISETSAPQAEKDIVGFFRESCEQGGQGLMVTFPRSCLFHGTEKALDKIALGSVFRGGTQAKVVDDCLTLLRVLRKYKDTDEKRKAVAKNKDAISSRAERRWDGKSMTWLEYGLELLADYYQHGVLRYDYRHTCQSDRGAINWPVTVRREAPWIEDGSVAYLSPHRRVVEQHRDHPLTVLHRQTVCELTKSFTGRPALELGGETVPSITPARARQILSVERNRVFRDRDRRVVAMLQALWLGFEDQWHSARADGVEFTEKFENVWEAMCREVLGTPKVDWSGLKPKSYHVSDSDRYARYKTKDVFDLRPDFVVRGSDCMVVCDAKYYTSGKLPESYDILKQLAYAHYLSHHWRGSSHWKHVWNVFLLPRQHSDEGKWFDCIGRHALEGGGRGKPMGDDIWLFELDYRTLARMYLAGQRFGIGHLVEQMQQCEQSGKYVREVES